MTVRPASPHDAHDVAAVQVPSRRAAYRGFFPDDYLERRSVEESASHWKERLADTTTRCLVAELDGRVAGYVWFGPAEADETGVGEVMQLYVHPAHWGRKAGSSLLEAALASLKHAGFRHAFLDVFEANERAIGFYEHLGWRRDPEPVLAERGGVTFRQLRYRRALAESSAP